MASIARTYDCSPPAISYILSRSRARTASAETLAAAPPADTRGVAPPQGGSPAADAARPAALAETAPRPGDGPAWPSRGLAASAADPPALQPSALSGGFAGNGVQNSELRRTLHLSHGAINGPERNGEAAPGLGARPPAPRPVAAEPAYPQPGRQSPEPVYPPGTGAPLRVLAEPRPRAKEGGAIDHVLRERVHAVLTAFIAAFDAALADDTSGSRAGLREATDHLLRVGARTRIELERLEARLPLPVRDMPAMAMPGWRPR